MSSSLTSTAAATLPVLLVWAGAVDIVTRAIPNLIVLLLVVSFGLFAAGMGLPARDFVAHFACAVTVLAGGFVLFVRSMIGGGDAKLLAAAALWFGFENLLPFLTGVAMAGGALAIAYLAVHAIRQWLGLTSERASTIPYGAAVAAGALAVLPNCLVSL